MRREEGIRNLPGNQNFPGQPSTEGLTGEEHDIGTKGLNDRDDLQMLVFLIGTAGLIGSAGLIQGAMPRTDTVSRGILDLGMHYLGGTRARNGRTREPADLRRPPGRQSEAEGRETAHRRCRVHPGGRGETTTWTIERTVQATSLCSRTWRRQCAHPDRMPPTLRRQRSRPPRPTVGDEQRARRPWRSLLPKLGTRTIEANWTPSDELTRAAAGSTARHRTAPGLQAQLQWGEEYLWP